MWLVAPVVLLVVAGLAFLFYQGAEELLGKGVTKPVKPNDVIKTTATAFTLLGAVLAGIYAYRKQLLSEGDARREDARHLAERYSTAAEQLGHEQAAVRLAGVYAMARLADDWPEQRQVCVDVFCAYIRMPYQPAADQDGFKAGEREVRLTLLRVIRDHLQDPEAPTSWCRYDLDFTGATFDGGDFTNARFTDGHVNFEGAQFTGGEVTFDGAQFTGGEVTFDGAQFTGGEVTFDGAQFTGGEVTFDGARFTDGYVSFALAVFADGEISFLQTLFNNEVVSFQGAHFIGGTASFFFSHFTDGVVYFDSAGIVDGTLSFFDAKFTNCSTSFEAAQFIGGQVDFRRAQFSSGRVLFRGAQFTGGYVEFDSAVLSDDVTTVDFTHSRVTIDARVGWGPFPALPPDDA